MNRSARRMRLRERSRFARPGATALFLAAAMATGSQSASAQNAAVASVSSAALASPAPSAPFAGPVAGDPVLMQAMEAELHRAQTELGATATQAMPAAGKASAKVTAQPKPYFLSYSVADFERVNITSSYGAISGSNDTHARVADVQVRIGAPAMDNTHGDHRTSALTTMQLPLTDDEPSIERTLWFATNRGYGKALDAFEKVKTEQQVRAKEEDASADFSRQQPESELLRPASKLSIDQAVWESRLREITAVFRRYPNIYYDTAILSAAHETDYFVSSEGTRVAAPSTVARLVIVARTRAADGMDLFRVETFEADTDGHLPAQSEVLAKTEALARNLDELRVAPITEPYNGPAILSGRAAAVFFHEVLGHRLEGQRQRGDEEGQTFTKLLNHQILPTFLSVTDDPTISAFDGHPLSGHYIFDDEGQPAQKVDLIKDGVLKTFLMSRLPVASFSESNGHGRAETGKMPTGRQGNLIVSSTKTVSDAELREMLKAEAKKQGKAYGLFFEDISSGFAVTTRRSPQAFQVMPLVVYRVYVDGRPDELVRGVSIVGTPQAALNRIVATGDHQDIFNGECGAESGTVPVSAVAPAMLVSEIETQRQSQGTARPPIVEPPPLKQSQAATTTDSAAKGGQ
ncbi:Predicted Zn-dependent protease or its inactivated homolog [Bryocella elongata]|uniref:Predicted Zn-dependent protease or its inactivated homolog n=1 Tax=Bryocella elongata TaxID=863522 RepID=A0A1H6BL03_9BACT|nr:metallopeptidase TldD-related protein [Bryocella elongata]SEG61401.1 Predicted Zn-dependent protease or its inactivated homolog [Bryocella elongata]